VSIVAAGWPACEWPSVSNEDSLGCFFVSQTAAAANAGAGRADAMRSIMGGGGGGGGALLNFRDPSNTLLNLRGPY
jgi:hypothetical protein